MYKMVNGEQVAMSQAEIDELQAEWDTNAITSAKAENNRKILEKLKEIDEKSIRALRAGEAVRLAQLEQEAISLRTQLQ